MVQVVGYEEFKAVVDQLLQAEKHIASLTELLLSQRWLNRTQAMWALNVSESTLHRMTKSCRLTHRYESAKPLYRVAGPRAYMASQRIEDQRLMMAGQTN